MTRVEICVVLIGIVACAILGYGFVVMDHPHEGQSLKTVTRGFAGSSTQTSPSGAPDTPDTTDAKTTPLVNLLPVDASRVPDQTLLRLSGMVDLANAANERPNEAEWRQALPVAERLLACPCDCAQRNWLKRFVETGHCALDGSENDYHQAAQVLITLGRNNEQAVALSRPVR